MSRCPGPPASHAHPPGPGHLSLLSLDRLFPPPFSCPIPSILWDSFRGHLGEALPGALGLSDSCSSKHCAHAHQPAFTQCPRAPGTLAENETEAVSALVALTFPGRWDEETNRKRPDCGQDVRRTEHDGVTGRPREMGGQTRERLQGDVDEEVESACKWLREEHWLRAWRALGWEHSRCVPGTARRPGGWGRGSHRGRGGQRGG